MLGTKGVGRGLDIWPRGEWEWGGLPRVPCGSDLGQTKEERRLSQPLGRQYCIQKHSGWFSLNVQSSVTAVMTPGPLPTVLCLFSRGQEGLLPWASSSDNQSHAARNLWGWEDAT